MRSREDVLSINGFDFEAFFIDNEYSGNNLLRAMKDHAIDVAKEINKQGYREYDESDKWIKIEESHTVYTTEELYDKFDKENKV